MDPIHPSQGRTTHVGIAAARLAPALECCMYELSHPGAQQNLRALSSILVGWLKKHAFQLSKNMLLAQTVAAFASGPSSLLHLTRPVMSRPHSLVPS